MKTSSTNNYFFQSENALALGFHHMIYVLELRKFTDLQKSYFIKSYQYFCEHPSHYDGSTLSQDLEDFAAVESGYNGLELLSMLHDWVYIYLKARYSVAAMRIADEVMKIGMKRMQKSGFEITRRLFLLAIIRRPFAILNQIKTKFKIKADTVAIDVMYSAFAKAR